MSARTEASFDACTYNCEVSSNEVEGTTWCFTHSRAINAPVCPACGEYAHHFDPKLGHDGEWTCITIQYGGTQTFTTIEEGRAVAADLVRRLA